MVDRVASRGYLPNPVEVLEDGLRRYLPTPRVQTEAIPTPSQPDVFVSSLRRAPSVKLCVVRSAASSSPPHDSRRNVPMATSFVTERAGISPTTPTVHVAKGG